MDSQQRFLRVLGRKDVLALAFGAMVGWGWVILSGTWILGGGSIGAMLAFAATGLAILVVSLLYAELAAAMPRVGGEHVYSLRALGRTGSFICTWAIIFIYVSVVCFEAVAIATVFDYVDLNVKHFYLWTVAGYDVYLTWALIGIVPAIAITVINVLGVKLSAVFQTIATLLILLSGLMLLTGASLEGSLENLDPYFAAGSAGVLGVVAMVPFFFVGFDVIPQAAEEINLPYRMIGAVIALSVTIAIVWYCLVILGVATLSDTALLAESRLATADANAVAWGATGSNVMILGGIAGILTSWNAFVIGGSRAIFAMSESRMLPPGLGRLHGDFRTPYLAIVLIGLLSCIAPLLGRQALVWFVNAGSFGLIVAYLLVSVSFLRLRRSEPDLARPFRLPAGKLLGWTGVISCCAITLVYIPGSPSALSREEWLVVIAWTLLGLGFYVWSVVRQRRGPIG